MLALGNAGAFGWSTGLLLGAAGAFGWTAGLLFGAAGCAGVVPWVFAPPVVNVTCPPLLQYALPRGSAHCALATGANASRLNATTSQTE
jgi:hypothetical protein